MAKNDRLAKFKLSGRWAGNATVIGFALGQNCTSA
jgi:hypothetical protein